MDKTHVPRTNAVSGITHTICTAAWIILPSHIIAIQPIDGLRTNASCYWIHPTTVNCLQWLYTMRTHAGRISRLWIRVPIGIPTRSRNRLEGALGNRCPCPKRNNKTAYPLGARCRRCLYEGLCLIRLDLSWYILKQDLTEAELNYDIILIVMPRKESEIYAHQ